MRVSDRLARLLDPTQEERAACVLRAYFSPGRYTGAHFERFAGGGDRADVAHRFDADDLVAVSMLSISIPGGTALELLEHRSERLQELLEALPTDVEFADLDPEVVGSAWPARALYRELTAIKDIGETAATKLMARKRPHLVPILDSVVTAELSIEKGRLWEPLHAWLTRDGRANERHLRAVRDRAGLSKEISVLRVFDILTWMTGTGDADIVCPPDEASDA